MRARYRVWQFAQYLGARLSPAERQAARERLGPRLAALFEQLTPGEQAHSYRVMAALIAQGESDPNLLIAALLHDAGKSGAPMNVWGRTAAVLLRKFAPRVVERWGRNDGKSAGWRQPFVTAWHHAAWGAEMAERAGAAPLAVALIRRHQSPASSPPYSEEDRLLHRLQQADHEN